MSYDGEGFNPIFHSEISSSFLLHDIFDTHEKITAAFIKEYYDLEVENLQVDREKKIPPKHESIDLFITFTTNERKCALLIEVKVHDYTSVEDGQISKYYDAVSETQRYEEIYFIYLTQFDENTVFDNYKRP